MIISREGLIVFSNESFLFSCSTELRAVTSTNAQAINIQHLTDKPARFQNLAGLALKTVGKLI